MTKIKRTKYFYHRDGFNYVANLLWYQLLVSYTAMHGHSYTRSYTSMALAI